MSKILVTGGAGFIGSNFVHMLLAETDHQVVNLDLLTYAGNLENLSDVDQDEAYAFVRGDIADPAAMAAVFEQHRPDAVVHFAAESHVDRSVLDATAFVQTNVVGTQVLLDQSRRHGVGRFVHVSTDERWRCFWNVDVNVSFFAHLKPMLERVASERHAGIVNLGKEDICRKRYWIGKMVRDQNGTLRPAGCPT